MCEITYRTCDCVNLRIVLMLVTFVCLQFVIGRKIIFSVGAPFSSNEQQPSYSLSFVREERPFVVPLVSLPFFPFSGLIKLVTKHHAQMIYTRTIAVEDEETK